MEAKSEDLGVKIGTEAEVLWTNVLKNAKEVKRQALEQLTIQEEIILLAEKKIAEEKGKL